MTLKTFAFALSKRKKRPHFVKSRTGYKWFSPNILVKKLPKLLGQNDVYLKPETFKTPQLRPKIHSIQIYLTFEMIVISKKIIGVNNYMNKRIIYFDVGYFNCV